MEVLTPKMMGKCDQDTIKAGYPEILLMEAAAYGTASLAEEMIGKNVDFKEKEEVKITILIGKGNNGGDGLAAARILKNWGYCYLNKQNYKTAKQIFKNYLTSYSNGSYAPEIRNELTKIERI